MLDAPAEDLIPEQGRDVKMINTHIERVNLTKEAIPKEGIGKTSLDPRIIDSNSQVVPIEEF